MEGGGGQGTRIPTRRGRARTRSVRVRTRARSARAGAEHPSLSAMPTTGEGGATSVAETSEVPAILMPFFPSSRNLRSVSGGVQVFCR